VCNFLQIMLLTDGDVSNTREVISLVQNNAGNSRYITIVISGMHHQQCIAPLVYGSLLSG